MTDDAARLRETVAEAIYDCDSLRTTDPGLFQMIKGAAYYPGSVAHGIALEDADAALNAIRDAGLVVVRRDDVRSIVCQPGQPAIPGTALYRLRAAVQEGAGDE